jgi:hypothetical protein
MVNGQLERGAPPTAGEIIYCKSVVAAFVIGPTVRDGARRPQGSSAATPGRMADLALVQVSLTAVPLALTMSMERPSLPRCS